MIQRILGITVLILLSGCVSQAGGDVNSSSNLPADSFQKSRIILDDLGTAPELANSTWLNIDAPLTSVDLDGKVVLIDFWTFG